ncbi:Rne/Rng family ribonuclease [Enterobacteriaceae endosymbiont of Donacia tomentosa]|uniref:Rne/Rng family ribonuclease n=1 Tax=Enterobacteriaceae endosymbiont of Donacia tomentosa TaxID=2675787 RepID=UPI0014493D63|nr:Rne/Rng family ribonuclease [Enterobacteriaceae endosymbiont of Donacia tomentosa]QJC31533.1 Rne/Rng family ribonuclease [Enterobacteriaceae endosymbiont of Donacia tomentosa]
MKKMLINATQNKELRVALVKGQKLYNLDIENSKYKQKKSNIYKGKISHIEPSLEAVFVDYGVDKHGFLPIKEISKNYLPANYNNNTNFNFKNCLFIGQELIVQINKEERGNKGAALTTFITLAGSYLVLMPNNPNSLGISKRIDGEERNKLKKILLSLDLPNNMGLIIRTAGLGKSIETLKLDLQSRLKHWEIIKKISANKSSPFLIHQEGDIIIRSLRDHLCKDINEILIDDLKTFKLAKKYINMLGRSDLKHKIKLYTNMIPLFSYYQIESQIETIFQREVRLSSGGSIVIDTTEALTSIDVNSSKATNGLDIEETAVNINLEAADEIARQLRLRNLGGLIVIDFIDMSLTQNKKSVEKRLFYKVREDKAKIQMSHISKFGLLEMSRQRMSSSLRKSNYHICPKCIGNGIIRNSKSLFLSILRLIEEKSFKENTKKIYVIVPIKIAAYLLNKKKKIINNIKNKKIKIFIIPNNQLNIPNYLILRIKYGEEKKDIHFFIKKIYKSKLNTYYYEYNDIYQLLKHYSIFKNNKLDNNINNKDKIINEKDYFFIGKNKILNFLYFFKKNILKIIDIFLNIIFDNVRMNAFFSFFQKKYFFNKIFFRNLKENYEKKISFSKKIILNIFNKFYFFNKKNNFNKKTNFSYSSKNINNLHNFKQFNDISSLYTRKTKLVINSNLIKSKPKITKMKNKLIFDIKTNNKNKSNYFKLKKLLRHNYIKLYNNYYIQKKNFQSNDKKINMTYNITKTPIEKNIEFNRFKNFFKINKIIFDEMNFSNKKNITLNNYIIISNSSSKNDYIIKNNKFLTKKKNIYKNYILSSKFFKKNKKIQNSVINSYNHKLISSSLKESNNKDTGENIVKRYVTASIKRP